MWRQAGGQQVDFSGVAGSRGIGSFWPFGRMGNVDWVILRFWSRKCTQFFLGPRFSDFRPDGGCASSRLDHGLKVELNTYIKGPCISSSIFGPKFVQMLQLPASQPLEAALVANRAPKRDIPFSELCK